MSDIETDANLINPKIKMNHGFLEVRCVHCKRAFRLGQGKIGRPSIIDQSISKTERQRIYNNRYQAKKKANKTNNQESESDINSTSVGSNTV